MNDNNTLYGIVPVVTTAAVHYSNYLFVRMLKEILGTRIMVKSSMKQHKANRVRSHVYAMISLTLCS